MPQVPQSLEQCGDVWQVQTRNTFLDLVLKDKVPPLARAKTAPEPTIREQVSPGGSEQGSRHGEEQAKPEPPLERLTTAESDDGFDYEVPCHWNMPPAMPMGVPTPMAPGTYPVAVAPAALAPPQPLMMPLQPQMFCPPLSPMTFLQEMPWVCAPPEPMALPVMVPCQCPAAAAPQSSAHFGFAAASQPPFGGAAPTGPAAPTIVQTSPFGDPPNGATWRQTATPSDDVPAFDRSYVSFDARKLNGTDKQVVSKPIYLSVKGRPVVFKLMLCAKVEPKEGPKDDKASPGEPKKKKEAPQSKDKEGTFKTAGGIGCVQLKCEEELLEADWNVTFMIAIGSSADTLWAFGKEVTHNFSSCAVASSKEEMDFNKAVDKASQTFIVCLKIVQPTTPDFSPFASS